MTAIDSAVSPPHLGLQELYAASLRATSRLVNQRTLACAAAVGSCRWLYYWITC
jgi:hypothetical protein